jgi:hypothetical protein
MRSATAALACIRAPAGARQVPTANRAPAAPTTPLTLLTQSVAGTLQGFHDDVEPASNITSRGPERDDPCSTTAFADSSGVEAHFASGGISLNFDIWVPHLTPAFVGAAP